jgi:predicted RNA methylase
VSVRLSPEARDVLSRSAVAGNVVRLPEGQLPRPVYAAVDNVLKAMGGKWDRKQGGHAFPFDPSAKLADALEDGTVEKRQQVLQHFDTPLRLADYLVSKLGHVGGSICLEPSAGRGNIVQALASRDPDQVIAIEIDPDNAAELRALKKAHEIFVGDFLDEDPSGYGCDFVAMNPPFSRNQDIRHVRHAFECLRPSGRLAAIVSEHGFLGQERECVEWRQWLDDLDAEIEIVPAGAFKESGTSVQARMIVLDKLA